MNLIIIHNGERTLKECITEAEKQATVHLISEKPFSVSLRKTWELMVENKWEWAALMAADQILKPGAMKILQEAIHGTGRNIFRISSYGYDHLLMRDRMMAPCLYNVKYLKNALKLDFYSHIQPESFVLHEMNKQGFPFKIIADNLSVHDRGQYYRHIYNKGKAEAAKIMKYIVNNGVIQDLIYSEDNDHKVFLLGIFDYITKTTRTPNEAIESLGLKEKT